MIKKLTCLLILLGGCASVEAQLPVADMQSLQAETSAQEKQAFERYEEMAKRLDQVSTKILLANTELCPKNTSDIGVYAHTKKSYPKHLRDSSARWLGASDTPSVLFVGEKSPAAKAGLRHGDIILNAKGNAAGAGAKNVMGANNNVRIQRDGKELTFEILPRTMCDYRANLKMSGEINAFATGKGIVVTTGMMDFVESDEELALIIGHELAHNTMGHASKIMRNMLLSGLATRTTRPFESEADYIGLYHMARAGYDITGVEDFWRRLGINQPRSIVQAKTHPVTAARLLSIRLSAKEIETKRAAGEPLEPNMLSSK